MKVDIAGLRNRVTAATAVPTPPVNPAVPVSIGLSRSEPVKIYLTGIGTVQAYNTVAVKSRVDGEIIQVLFQEGQDVKAGDPLAIIDPRPFLAQLAQQRAARAKDEAMLQGAQLDLKRYEDLSRRDFASRQQVDQQRAQVDQYRAQIDSDQAQIDYAQTQLNYTTIRSPIEGRAGIRQIDQGNYVHASRQFADRGDHAVAADFGDLHAGRQFGGARQADAWPNAYSGDRDGGGRSHQAG